MGSLLVGCSAAKALAWAHGTPLVGVNHLEGHLYSPFLKAGGDPALSVSFEDVSFGYKPGVPVLYGISFTARPGTSTTDNKSCVNFQVLPNNPGAVAKPASLFVHTHTNYAHPGNKPQGGFAKTVTLLVRGRSLESSMSYYLIQQIAGLPSLAPIARSSAWSSSA